jgi:hypothetical protein
LDGRTSLGGFATQKGLEIIPPPWLASLDGHHRAGGLQLNFHTRRAAAIGRLEQDDEPAAVVGQLMLGELVPRGVRIPGEDSSGVEFPFGRAGVEVRLGRRPAAGFVRRRFFARLRHAGRLRNGLATASLRDPLETFVATYDSRFLDTYNRPNRSLSVDHDPQKAIYSSNRCRWARWPKVANDNTKADRHKNGHGDHFRNRENIDIAK